MDDGNFEERPTILAMKGHPGTGKSTLAKSIARTLKCPLIDKDHFKDCTKPLQVVTKLLNDLSYEAMWRVASTQLDLGLSVVIDSPLSRRAHLDRILELADRSGARVVILECKPRDEAEWRRRLERRSEVDGSSWHKPSTWQEMEKLLEGYEGCWDYDIGEVPRLVVDTTCANGVEEVVSSVLEFVSNACGAKRINNN
ncbi:hypothetical protein HAX54_033043 [Datura stramonium]|uniref:P-loop containing nucleoside triphosphate hydrolases superfamily protein n=1 Tax=Datura stramonium TaxID=4076 RepID=A0ABS8SD31_DATST|nr:hypothetical protein [Datura stramonium]